MLNLNSDQAGGFAKGVCRPESDKFLDRPFYPALASLLLCLEFALHNAVHAPARELLSIVALVPAAVLALTAGLRRVLPGHDAPAKAGALAALLLAAFFSEHMAEVLATWFRAGLGNTAAIRIKSGFLFAGIAVFAPLAWLALKRPALLSPLHKPLNGILAALCAIGAIRLSVALAAAGLGPAAAAAPRAAVAASPEIGLPDIVVLLLDGYTDHATMQRLWGHDDSAFLDGLRSRGFAVAEDAHSNYLATIFSMASFFNASIRCEQDFRDPASPSYAQASEWLMGSTVMRAYASAGGTLFRNNVGWAPMDTAWTHERFGPKSMLGSPWEAFWTMTVWHCLRNNNALMARAIRGAIEEFGTVMKDPRPKLVWLHLVCPHPPFVFAADGSVIPGRGFQPDGADFALWSNGSDAYRQGYTAQARFIAGEALRLIDQASALDRRPHVFIVMGDHGARLALKPDIRDNTESELRDAASCLFAIRMPAGQPPPPLRRGATLVNHSRAVFSRLFPGVISAEAVADVIYAADESRPYRFRPVALPSAAPEHP